MSRGERVDRPLKRSEHEIVFITRQAGCAASRDTRKRRSAEPKLLPHVAGRLAEQRTELGETPLHGSATPTRASARRSSSAVAEPVQAWPFRTSGPWS